MRKLYTGLLAGLLAGWAGSAAAATVTINVTTDNWPYEISWQILEVPGFAVVEEVQPGFYYPHQNTTFHTPVDLAPGTYAFVIWDGYGDGICCSEGPGIWSIDVPGFGTIVSPSGGQYGKKEKVFFTVVDPVPLPPALPLFATGLAIGWLGWRRRNARRPAAT
jgi:hypothetical protein